MDWTRREMMAVAASHQIRADDVVVVGLGLPQIAAVLAKKTHAPGATLLLELGVVEPAPTEPAMGIADPRLWAGAQAFGEMIDVLGYLLHGGRVTLGILGALQVDMAGSINSSLVTLEDGTSRRFTGSGGANDIASLARRVMVVMAHDRRKFRERLDFLTSPGRVGRGGDRRALGLRGTGAAVIVTDRAVIEVTDQGFAMVSAHPGDDPEGVAQDTPVPLAYGSATVTEAPTELELSVIREELDPYGWYTRP